MFGAGIQGSELIYGQKANYQAKYSAADQTAESSEYTVCIYCGSKCFKRHGYYSRYFFNCIEDVQDSNTIMVLVLECTCETCPHRYQAVLPDWICPFSPFSYPFIFAILDAFYNQLNQNFSAAASLFGISRRQVRTIVSKFDLEQLEMRQTSVCQESSHKPEKTVRSLNGCPLLLLFFLFEFMLKTSRAFMTRHFKPASKWSFIRYSWTGAIPNKPDT